MADPTHSSLEQGCTWDVAGAGVEDFWTGVSSSWPATSIGLHTRGRGWLAALRSGVSALYALQPTMLAAVGASCSRGRLDRLDDLHEKQL